MTSPDTVKPLEAAERLQPLLHTRILSLALNLPGPAALLRCLQMGAQCTKLEPPSTPGQPSADPMGAYSPHAYAALHAGVRVLHAQLKTAAGQAALHAELADTDVLLTSFRPSALRKLELDPDALQPRYPRLSVVRIVGAAGTRAEEPGHDLTYQAEAGLVTGTDLPPSLFADMAGALLASEAVLQAQLARSHSGRGVCIEVALADAAQWLALPRQWGLTLPDGDVGGGHAGYRIYDCADGRVALAALEPHFALRLCESAGVPVQEGAAAAAIADLMRAPAPHAHISAFLRLQTRAVLEALAKARDIPMHTLA